MRHFILLFAGILMVFGCKDTAIEKPDNLIDQDKMVDIIYDLSLLQAIKLDNPVSVQDKNINPSGYVYAKYKIDSIQFAQSDRYYAADMNNYKKMYEKVNARLESDKKKADSIVKAHPEPALKIPVIDTVKKVVKKGPQKRKFDVKFN